MNIIHRKIYYKYLIPILWKCYRKIKMIPYTMPLCNQLICIKKKKKKNIQANKQMN